MSGIGEGFALEAISFARHVAEHARSLGVDQFGPCERTSCEHFGAILADTVLQAGLNYRKVVKPRIERIVRDYPRAADLAGVVEVIETNAVSDFLLWNHSEKIGRFVRVVDLFQAQSVNDVKELREWLRSSECREKLLEIRGIGPKSVDYLGCLLGIDCIAVDRHIRAFVREAGIEVVDYDLVSLVVSYAADLLGVRRRDFDAWIWNLMSFKSAATH